MNTLFYKAAVLIFGVIGACAISSPAMATCPVRTGSTHPAITVDDCRIQYQSNDASTEGYLSWDFPVASTTRDLQFEFSAQVSGPIYLTIWAIDQSGKARYGLGYRTVMVTDSGTHRLRVPVTDNIKAIRWAWSFDGAQSSTVSMLPVTEVQREPCTVVDTEYAAAVAHIKADELFPLSSDAPIGVLGQTLACGTDTIARRWAYSALKIDLRKADRHTYWFPTKLKLAADTLTLLAPNADANADVSSLCKQFGRASKREVLLVLPGTDNIPNYAKCASDLIKQGQRYPSAKWTIDLREGGGGNLYAMLEGIAAFLSDGVILRFTGLPGLPIERVWKSPTLWHIRGQEKTALFTLPALPAKVSAKKLTVLIGPGTASSSEAVAMILKAAGARLVGKPTMGLATVVEPLDLPEGLLGFSVAWMAYPDGSRPPNATIQPD